MVKKKEWKMGQLFFGFLRIYELWIHYSCRIHRPISCNWESLWCWLLSRSRLPNHWSTTINAVFEFSIQFFISNARKIKCDSSLENHILNIKFIYSEKATNFCEISTIDLSYVVQVKSTVEILQNFLAFSEYMNFKQLVNLCI